MLRERKEKILATYEVDQVRRQAAAAFHQEAAQAKPPKELASRLQRAIQEEQIRELERSTLLTKKINPLLLTIGSYD